MKAQQPIRSPLLFSISIFANEVAFSWGLLPFPVAIVILSEFGSFHITLTSDKSAVSWDDNTVVVYSKEQHWQGRLFHQPNCPKGVDEDTPSRCDVWGDCKGQTAKSWSKGQTIMFLWLNSCHSSVRCRQSCTTLEVRWRTGKYSSLVPRCFKWSTVVFLPIAASPGVVMQEKYIYTPAFYCH